MFAFTLMLRLDDAADMGSEWQDWSDVGRSEAAALYKVLPGGEEYFVPPVERVLFPAASGPKGRRWVHIPAGWTLRLPDETHAEAKLRIDLLEVVRFPLAPYVTYGIVHLSTDAQVSDEAMQHWSQALGTRYRRDRGGVELAPLYVFEGGSGEVTFDGKDPLRGLADELFDCADSMAGRRAYVCTFARVSPPCAADLRVWSRAFARGRSLEESREALERSATRDDARTEEIGAVTVTVFALGAAFLHERDEYGDWLENLRSYWSEALLLGLAQHAYVEEYADGLARLGDNPLSEGVSEMHLSWLAYRNVIGSHYLAATTDVPRKLLLSLGRELETASLYTEVQSSFENYVEEKRRRAEERNAAAFRNLQVVGAGAVAVGMVAAILQVVAFRYVTTHQWFMVAFLVVIGLVTGALVYCVLAEGPEQGQHSA